MLDEEKFVGTVVLVLLVSLIGGNSCTRFCTVIASVALVLVVLELVLVLPVIVLTVLVVPVVVLTVPVVLALVLVVAPVRAATSSSISN